MSNNWLKLLGWILTDGTVYNNSRVCIYQTKKQGIKEIERLLKMLNLKYSKYGPYKRNYQFYIHAEYSRKVSQKLSLTKEKKLPKWTRLLSRKQVIILLKAIISGDGNKRKYDTTISGTEKRLKEFATLFNKKSISCSVWHNKRGDWYLQIHQGYGI